MALQQSTTDFEQIEQKLIGFSQQIAQSSSVLDNLAVIQTQFEDLAQTYQSLKDYTHQAKLKNQNLESAQAETERRLQALDSRLGTLQSSLATMQKDWENPREAVEIYLDNLENRLRTELRGALNHMEQAGFNPTQLDKLDKLDTQVRAFRTSLRTAERRGRILQNWLVATSITALMALGIPLLLPFVRPDAQPTPAREVKAAPAKDQAGSPSSEPSSGMSEETSSSLEMAP